MSKEKAFPQSQFRGDEPVDTSEHGGMQLRDYFAAKAMQSVVNAIFQNGESASIITKNSNKRGELEKEYISKIAYEFADSMMAERSER